MASSNCFLTNSLPLANLDRNASAIASGFFCWRVDEAWKFLAIDNATDLGGRADREPALTAADSAVLAMSNLLLLLPSHS